MSKPRELPIPEDVPPGVAAMARLLAFVAGAEVDCPVSCGACGHPLASHHPYGRACSGDDCPCARFTPPPRIVITGWRRGALVGSGPARFATDVLVALGFEPTAVERDGGQRAAWRWPAVAAVGLADPAHAALDPVANARAHLESATRALREECERHGNQPLHAPDFGRITLLRMSVDLARDELAHERALAAGR